jgi:hypothetical protein
MGTSFRGGAARACALPALHRDIVAQHGAHGAHGPVHTHRGATARHNALFPNLQHGAHDAGRMQASYGIARALTRARGARRSAHSGERQHGPAHYSLVTARHARRRAHAPARYSPVTTRHARRRAHAGKLQHGAVPTQFKATQLVVAIAVWAIPVGLTLKLLDFDLSILLLNNASEQYYITIG